MNQYTDEIEEDVSLEITNYVTEMVDSGIQYPDYTRTTLQQRGAELAAECLPLGVYRLNHAHNKGMSGYPVLATETGKAVEDLVMRNMLENYGNRVALWDEFIPKTNKAGLRYSGKVDILLDLPGVGYVVVDLKTTLRISDEKMLNLKYLKEVHDTDPQVMLDGLKNNKLSVRKSPLTEQGMKNYVAQVVGYATFLDVDHAVVYAISRTKENWAEPLTTKAVYVEVTEDMKFDCVAKVLLRQRLAERKAVPAKPKHFKKTVQCKYCDFNDNCYADIGNEGFTMLTADQTTDEYEQALIDGTELYKQFRGMYAWIRDKKIEEAKTMKAAIAGDETAKNIVLNSHQITNADLFHNLTSLYEMKDAEQNSYRVNTYTRK